MLFFILLIVTISVFVIFNGFLRMDWEDSFCLCLIEISLMAIMIVAVSAIVLTHISADADKLKYEQRYNSLVYQLESGIYDKNDHDIATGTESLYNLYREIERWNCDLAECKVLSKDFWWGIFYADIYDDFQFIEYPKIQ